MNEVFSARVNIYDTRKFNVFQTHIPTSNRYGLNSKPYNANQLWNLLPENLKTSLSLNYLKKKKNCGTTLIAHVTYVRVMFQT